MWFFSSYTLSLTVNVEKSRAFSNKCCTGAVDLYDIINSIDKHEAINYAMMELLKITIKIYINSTNRTQMVCALLLEGLVYIV